MRHSPWDMVAPGYWTGEQRRAIEALREQRRLSVKEVRLRKAKEARKRVRSWLLSVVMLAIGALASCRRDDPELFEARLEQTLLPSWAVDGFAHFLDVVWSPLVFWGAIAIYFLVFAIALLDMPNMRRGDAGPARALRVHLARTSERRPSPERLALLSADLRERRSLWMQRISDRRHAMSGRLEQLAAAGCVALFVFFAFLAVGWKREVVMPASGIVVIAGVVVWAYWFAGRTPLRKLRLNHCLAKEVCVACGYSLAGVRPAIAAELLDGQNIGPERCPECGSYWPLLPPPLSPTGCPVSVVEPPDEGREPGAGVVAGSMV